MKTYGGLSRRQLFEKLDQPLLQPLPATRFIYGEWKKARVNIDYHIAVDRHYYSVPHPLIHEEVEARLSATTVEIFRKGQRLCVHPRSYLAGRHTTLPEHMPKAHRAHLEWSPSRLIHWASTIGSQTEELVRQILESRRHPEQGYRSCLGILRLHKHYGPDRLEAACARAVAAGARSFRHIDSMLKHGLDQLPLAPDPPASVAPPPIHENIRGQTYFTEGEDACSSNPLWRN
jgi:transposase